MKKIRYYYRLISMMIILMFLLTGQNLFAQSVEVSGIIKDQKGETIIGATVMEKGTTNGSVTNVNGEFRLTVSRNDAVLTVSFIGYQPQEIPLNGNKTFNITLVESVSVLSEVVVVGYGSQKKESVVGAISQLSTDQILSTAATNITQAISGKISGVTTSQASGTPGSDNAKIYIRGRATFAGDGQPLVLVDGVEREFSQIAPDDIQTISVLKDASATAVYGVRGANGVILVSTKRGRDQKPVVSLTTSWQSQSPTRKNTYLNSYQSVGLLEEALANDNLPSQFSAAAIDMYRRSSLGELSGVDAALYPNVDWYNTILRSSAPSQRYNVNIQGGTKKMRYFASGEYYNQQGLFKNLSLDPYGNSSNTSFERYSFRANLDYLISSNLTMSVNFGTRFETRTGPNAEEKTIFYEMNHTPGWIFPISYDNVVMQDGTTQSLYGGSSQYQNNIAANFARSGFYNTTNTINETNFTIDYNMDWLTKGLRFRGMTSLDYNAIYKRPFTASFATYELNDRNNYGSIAAYNKFNVDSKLALSGASNRNTMKLYFEFQLNYARTFGRHDVTAMVLYNQNDLRANADLPARYQGLVGRATYSYDSRYLFEFNAGYNGSENFMVGNRFGFFPAFSLGWRVSQEDFMASTQNWLNNLKIRGTYGEVGNDKYEGQRFLYEEKWTQGNRYMFGTSSAATIQEGAYPNYGVTWERAVKYNLGIEFALFKDLLKGNFDIFSEKRDNILTQYLTKPQWMGISLAAGNLGKTKNSGFEIELVHAKSFKDFDYSIGITFGRAKNKILDMDEPALKTDYRKLEGNPIKQYFGLISDGFLTAADLADPNLPVSSYGSVKVGDLKYRDVNKDGIINDQDITAIGFSDIPENNLSLNAGINYKSWGFNMAIQSVSNVSRYYDAEAMFAFVDGGKVKEHHLDRWDPSQSEAYNLANAKYPLLHYDNYGDHNQRLNSFFLKNGAFVRLKTVELSYTLPSAWTKHVGMSNVRLYANASNLFTWDHIDGIADPESNGSNSYPIMKTTNFGVNVKF